MLKELPALRRVLQRRCVQSPRREYLLVRRIIKRRHKEAARSSQRGSHAPARSKAASFLGIEDAESSIRNESKEAVSSTCIAAKRLCTDAALLNLSMIASASFRRVFAAGKMV